MNWPVQFDSSMPRVPNYVYLIYSSTGFWWQKFAKWPVTRPDQAEIVDPVTWRHCSISARWLTYGHQIIFKAAVSQVSSRNICRSTAYQGYLMLVVVICDLQTFISLLSYAWGQITETTNSLLMILPCRTVCLMTCGQQMVLNASGRGESIFIRHWHVM